MNEKNAVIGLAGHVDHGKTALIKALTGMDIARANEKKLGMTQDLGFAHLTDEAGQTLGIIDVPGHERYVRNMVAGIWNIDVLLLVISAEEGCMPMTLTHTRLARAMGVESIIVCINKSDKVDSQQLEQVEESALETVMDIAGVVPEIISVSALTGDNIAELKTLLFHSAKQAEVKAVMPCAPDAPLLYVDRAFVVNGIGTVVTGTLAQGALNVGDKLYCPRSKVTGAIRSIQTYHQQVEQAQSSCRVALNIKGINRKQIARGDLLCVASAPVSLSSSCIVRLKGEKPSRAHQTQVAFGSWHGFGELIPLPNSNLARLVFTAPVPLYFGQRLIMAAGSEHQFSYGEVVWREFIPKHKKRFVYQALSELPSELTAQAQLNMLLGMQGYYPSELLLGEQPDTGTVIDEFVFDSQWLEKRKTEIVDLLNQGQAMSSGEIAGRLRLDEEIAEILTLCLKSSGDIYRNYGKWQTGSGQSEDDLPQEALAILRQIRAFGRDGLELNKVNLGKDKKWLRQLAHQKYVTALDELIYFDMGVYLELVQAVILDHQAQDQITLQLIKERTQLSRKYAIPLANRMEKDGWLRRDGEVRIILRSWG